ncbi:MAG: biopolymer transporter ExbD [Verrucomicrobiota bacterium]|jgi:biopolymer transport protein ExbD|nr:biopolymer transporter ExbD [Verrucomicrobiota bacterium]MDP6753971.1 biopolymer transporter ExbD [Verrucomicrobiota bacterium]
MRFIPRKNRKPPTVIIVALIDVLMVVLIFMVVSTTFTNQAAVKLALPESSQAKATPAPAVSNHLVVTVAKEVPYIHLGSETVEPDALEAELKSAVEANPELELSIRADTDAPFGMIIKVMDAAKAADITSVKAYTREANGQ